ncbi:MAG: hypothetical protein MZV65_38400 [Chromatiales bacterium]|nr:hypothetical protein [Chromatiales bacterium]
MVGGPERAAMIGTRAGVWFGLGLTLWLAVPPATGMPPRCREVPAADARHRLEAWGGNWQARKDRSRPIPPDALPGWRIVAARCWRRWFWWRWPKRAARAGAGRRQPSRLGGFPAGRAGCRALGERAERAARRVTAR